MPATTQLNLKRGCFIMTKTNTKVIKRAKGKKVDVKRVAKQELSDLFEEFLIEKGIKVSSNADDFAFTQGTLVVHMEDTDVQVKLITPKAGLKRYQEVVYVTEEEYDEIQEQELIDEIELEEEIQEMELEDALAATVA